ncbi:MAG: YncE family protein [Chloroflexi bacterium]|nr:YncE family protein [Chloroflexota bacterium]
MTGLAVGVACSGGGVAQEDYDAVQAELNSAQSDLQAAQIEAASLQTELAGQVAPGAKQVVQVGAAQPATPDQIVQGWETAAALKMGIKLLETFDSSGPAAWDAAAHPYVFVTSEGEGYAGYLSETYTGAGLQIIDARTKEHIVSAEFDLGFEKTGEPHGMAVSPDGRWIYVPTADGDAPWRAGLTGGRLLVVDAKTLKIAQILQTRGGPHHIKAFTDYEGNDRIIVELQGRGVILLDPNDDHRVVVGLNAEDFKAESYQVDADPAGENLYINLHLGSRGIASELLAAVGKYNLESGRLTYITGVGMYTNGFAFTSDGRYTYVSDSSGDRVYKIDNSTNKVVANTQAGVPGPYNLELNDDETELWIVGKGEMTFNLGSSIALVDTRSFRAVNVFDIGGQTIDHDIVNPAASNELWVTSSGTAEIIVFDMEKREVIARIPTANTGDTHSGAFVHYNPDFTGELLADNSGRRGAFLDVQKAAVSAIASAR